jgi:ribonuclease Z
VTLEDGSVVTPAELVGPPRRGRKVVLSGDTAPCDAVRELAMGADLLVHEATFGEDEKLRARETRHSTALDAATIARDAKVRRLVLTHLSARYSREAPELLTEAREVFDATIIARDGLVIEVPFQDN